MKDCNRAGTVSSSDLKYTSNVTIVTDSARKTRIMMRYNDSMDTDFDVWGMLSDISVKYTACASRTVRDIPILSPDSGESLNANTVKDAISITGNNVFSM